MRTQAEFEAMFNCKAPAGQLFSSACWSAMSVSWHQSDAKALYHQNKPLPPHQFDIMQCNGCPCLVSGQLSKLFPYQHSTIAALPPSCLLL